MSDRETVAAWMIAHGFATGHGDTTADLLGELEVQLDERRVRAEKAEAALASPVAGEVEELASEISRLAVNTDNPHEAEYFDRIAARLRRFGRVPKLETTKHERDSFFTKIEGVDIWPKMARAIKRDIEILLAHMEGRTDG